MACGADETQASCQRLRITLMPMAMIVLTVKMMEINIMMLLLLMLLLLMMMLVVVVAAAMMTANLSKSDSSLQAIKHINHFCAFLFRSFRPETITRFWYSQTQQIQSACMNRRSSSNDRRAITSDLGECSAAHTCIVKA
eukprot:s2643_g12.t2